MKHLDAIRRPLLDVLLAASFLAAAASIAAAQSAPTERPAQTGHIFVFAGAGGNTQTDDESGLGTGIGLEGGLGYRLSETWSVEGTVAHLRHSRTLAYSIVSTDELGRTMATPYSPTLTGGATYVLGELRHAFSTSRLRPQVGFGAGVMRYSGDSWNSVMAPMVGGLVGPSRTVKTSAAGSVSAGVDISAGNRVSFAPFVNLLMSNPGETGTWIAVFSGVRVSVGK